MPRPSDRKPGCARRLDGLTTKPGETCGLRWTMADPVIRFCRLADDTRIAYSTHGSGPLLVCPAWWVSHLERDWQQPAFHDFFETLAQHRTVVRYDRPGVGLSKRERHDFTQETEVEVLDAIVARLAKPTVDLLAFSCAAPVALTWAVANPGRVRTSSRWIHAS